MTGSGTSFTKAAASGRVVSRSNRAMRSSWCGLRCCARRASRIPRWSCEMDAGGDPCPDRRHGRDLRDVLPVDPTLTLLAASSDEPLASASLPTRVAVAVMHPGSPGPRTRCEPPSLATRRVRRRNVDRVCAVVEIDETAVRHACNACPGLGCAGGRHNCQRKRANNSHRYSD